MRMLDQININGMELLDTSSHVVWDEKWVKKALTCLSWGDDPRVGAFDCTNVADALRMGAGDAFSDLSDFPSVVPPFEITFIEFRHFWAASPCVVGWLFWHELDAERKLFKVLGHAFVSRPGTYEKPKGPIFTVGFEANERGILDTSRGDKSAALAMPSGVHSLSGRDATGSPDERVDPIWKVPFLAFSLMKCKNSSVVTMDIPAALQRSHERKHGAPRVTYKTLEISLPGVSRGGYSSQGRGEPQRSFHICRGHFATYDGAGLFGKYKGTFWKPAHTRGDLKNGMVVKNYKLKVAAA